MRALAKQCGLGASCNPVPQRFQLVVAVVEDSCMRGKGVVSKQPLTWALLLCTQEQRSRASLAQLLAGHSCCLLPQMFEQRMAPAVRQFVQKSAGKEMIQHGHTNPRTGRDKRPGHSISCRHSCPCRVAICAVQSSILERQSLNQAKTDHMSGANMLRQFFECHALVMHTVTLQENEQSCILRVAVFDTQNMPC
jgi:hypothetical protein